MRKIICLLLALPMIINTTCFTAYAEEGNNAEQVSVQTVTDDVESISTDTVNLYVSDKKSDDPNTYIDLATALAAADKIDKQEKQVIITMKGGTYEIDKTVTISAKSN